VRPFPARDNQWRDLLLQHGHIVLLPNSFSSRGLKSQCRETHRVATSFGLRRTDAIASAAWLVAQPGTPSGGVVLWGWSDGASTVMATAKAAPDVPENLFRGYVAFYPGCFVAVRDKAWRPSAPMLILMGAADDWTPAKPCQGVADRFTSPLLSMIAYPDAYHDFDAPGGVRVMTNVPSSQNADKSVHAGTNLDARADALERAPAFVRALPPLP
jgi:dienelactone hydrolase